MIIYAECRLDQEQDYEIIGNNESSYEIIEKIESQIPIVHHMDYNELFNPQSNPLEKHLHLSTSGGQGHLSAMRSILTFYPIDALTLYDPIPYENKQKTSTRTGIHLASYANTLPWIQKSLEKNNIIAVPEHGLLMQGINKLHSKTSRPYVDVALDAYSAGYESIAIWNELQRQDKKNTLAQLVDLQPIHDQKHYNRTHGFFYELLIQAYNKGSPYRKVISTQVLGLPALCDAVIQYNDYIRAFDDEHVNIIIEQFITDLPSRGAVHFFNALEKLKPAQQSIMNIHAVNLSQDVLNHFFPNNFNFKTLYSIDPKQNPMVHRDFTSGKRCNDLNQAVELIADDGTTYIISENQKVATIMLGGQAGIDSSRYIPSLFDNAIDMVFVLGGRHAEIQAEIDNFLRETNGTKPVVSLAFQYPAFIAQLMSRSAVVIVRSGGLTMMEQLAMHHHPDQIILLHHADTCAHDMKSGIIWEDYNADGLIRYLEQDQIRVLKTSPSNVALCLNSDYKVSLK